MTVISYSTQNAAQGYAFSLTATAPPVTQQSAYHVEAAVSVFTTVPPGGTCVLPTNVYLAEREIINRGLNVLIVLPGPGWAIEGFAVNSGVAIRPGGSGKFISEDPRSEANPFWRVR